MSDSLTKIIEEMRELASDIESDYLTGYATMVDDLASRLEALQDGPVAWIRGEELRTHHACWTDERAADKGWIPLYAFPQEVKYEKVC